MPGLRGWLLPLRRRYITALLALVAIVAILVARASAYILAPAHVAAIRDWLTVALMLVPYWQTGQFFLGPNEKIQARLVALTKGGFRASRPLREPRVP